MSTSLELFKLAAYIYNLEPSIDEWIMVRLWSESSGNVKISEAATGVLRLGTG